jgi:hypothetical protein
VAHDVDCGSPSCERASVARDLLLRAPCGIPSHPSRSGSAVSFSSSLHVAAPRVTSLQATRVERARAATRRAIARWTRRPTRPATRSATPSPLPTDRSRVARPPARPRSSAKSRAAAASRRCAIRPTTPARAPSEPSPTLHAKRAPNAASHPARRRRRSARRRPTSWVAPGVAGAAATGTSSAASARETDATRICSARSAVSGRRRTARCTCRRRTACTGCSRRARCTPCRTSRRCRDSCPCKRPAYRRSSGSRR